MPEMSQKATGNNMLCHVKMVDLAPHVLEIACEFSFIVEDYFWTNSVCIHFLDNWAMSHLVNLNM